MKLSVIVTTYNRPDALKKVLDGLIHQTRRPDEIIIADDGSGEETAAMVAPYLARKDIRILHVWQEDDGFRLSRSRNKAILASSGDYIVIMDGDCIPESRFIEDHEALAEEGCFFQGKRVLVNEPVEKTFVFRHIDSVTRLLWYALTGKISNFHHIFRIGFFPSYRTTKLSGVRGCNTGFFRKDLFAVNGYNQEITGWGREDSEIVIRLYNYGLKRKENPFRAICYHLWHPENSRNNLHKNDEIMEDTRTVGGYTCRLGLEQLGNIRIAGNEKGCNT